MAPVLENIADSLLPQLEGVTVHEKWLECSRKYPWYPLSWLMLADTGDKESVDMAALWFNDEQRLHWLLHSKPITEDKWLAGQLQDAERSRPVSEPIFDSKLPELNNEEFHEPIIEEKELTGHLKQHDNYKPEPLPEMAPKSQIIKEEQHSPIIDENWLADQLRQLDTAKPAQKTEPIQVAETAASKTAEAGPGSVKAELPPDAAPVPGIIKQEASVIPGLRPQNQPAANADPLVFEPYYAVDYFASQGIKLDLAGMPKDKLEKQLKSFTQWLKTMKKVNTEPAAYADPVVEAQAVESNTGKEVVTEAMAQVLEKQDKFDKAITIYEKLILLYPEKGALFAARIEDLKKKQ